MSFHNTSMNYADCDTCHKPICLPNGRVAVFFYRAELNRYLTRSPRVYWRQDINFCSCMPCYAKTPSP